MTTLRDAVLRDLGLVDVATMRRAVRLAAVVTFEYLSCIVVANWLTTHYGFVPVGFGYAATAGTFAAGGALVVRDVLQDVVGRLGVAVLIVLGAMLSYLIAGAAIATASGVAFLLSEALDMLVYTPLRARGTFGDRRWAWAVAAGAIVGSIADSIVFLWIAFGRDSIRPAITGQLVGKLEVAAALIVLGVSIRALLRKPNYAASS